jgi:AAA ATPase domain
MKISLNNIGALKTEVELIPAQLTVFSGGNNTGKTYAMYLLWALFKRRTRHVFEFAEKFAEQLRVEGSVQIPLQAFCDQHWTTIEKGIADGLRKHLPDVFRAPQDMFKEAQVKLTLNSDQFIEFAKKHKDFKRSIEVGNSGNLDVRLTCDDGDNFSVALTALGANKLPLSLVAEIVSSLIIDLILSSQIESVFLLPAERGGLNLFYLDLDAKNATLVRHLKRDDSNPVDLFRDMMVAQYAQPIESYIDFLKRAPRITKNGGDFHDQALALQKEIANVRYKVSKEGVITAKPYKSDAELGIHLTSSTVKSLYGLWAWLELQAKPGDCLMIDEPELNLHPNNQRLVARLLVRLVNRGIKVIISTHSDYIIRELNNMIMLASDFISRNDLEKKFGYDPNGLERLSVDKVAAYHFTNKSVIASTVSSEFGIEVKSMDEAINNLNESNGDIYYALGESLHPIVESETITFNKIDSNT